MDIQTVACPLLHNLSEQTNYGQVVQIGCFRFVVKQAVCSDSYTTKHLVRDTLRPDKTADNLPYEKVGNNEPVCIADEVPFDIPDSWEWCRLSSVNDMYTGNSINQTDKKTKYTNLSTGYYYIGTKDVGFDHTIDYDNGVKIPYNNSKFKIAPKNCILLCIEGGSAGRKIAFTNQDICFGNKLCCFISYGIDYLFLYYYLQSPLFQEIFKKNTTGIIGGVSVNTLKSLYFPVPPLAEQKRIIERILCVEQYINLYAISENAITSLDNSFPELLKKSILQEAVQGKLVPQDPNDEPASVLLERIRAEKQALIKAGKIKKDKHESVIFRRDNSHYEKLNGIERCIDDELPFEIPKNWQWERWGNISQSIQYGYNAPAKSDGKIKMVRISDIQNNTVKWDSVPFCDIAEDDIETYLLKSNDILFARTGGTVGKSYLVTEILEDAIYAGYLIRTRYSDELIPKYLKYFMGSELYWSQLRSGTIATAQPNCNGQTLSKMLLPIPPKAEQERIIQMIDTLYSKI